LPTMASGGLIPAQDLALSVCLIGSKRSGERLKSRLGRALAQGLQ